MLADYHVHSEYSDDSFTPMEAHIRRALELGLEEVCFTEHVDYGIKKDWTESPLPMRDGAEIGAPGQRFPLTNADYPAYFRHLRQLREAYAGHLALRAGLELGVQCHTIPRYRKLLEVWGQELDFLLLSVHQVEDREFWSGRFMEGRSQDEYNRRYYEELLAVVQQYDGFDALAHVDLIARYDPAGPWPFAKLRDLLAEIFRVIIGMGKGIEINTSSWHYGLPDTTPSRDILRLYRSLGGRIITMGSDAHTPKYLGDRMPEAQALLKSLGFDSFYTYEGRRAIGHKL